MFKSTATALLFAYGYAQEEPVVDDETAEVEGGPYTYQLIDDKTLKNKEGYSMELTVDAADLGEADEKDPERELQCTIVLKTQELTSDIELHFGFLFRYNVPNRFGWSSSESNDMGYWDGIDLRL